MEIAEIETMIQRILKDDPTLVRKVGDEPLGVSVDLPSTPLSFNKTMILADTEYEVPIPTGTKRLSVRMRSTSYAWLFTWQQGSFDNGYYNTVPAMGEYFEDGIKVGQNTKLFVRCATAGQVLECTFWV